MIRIYLENKYTASNRGSTTQTEKALREVSDECRTQDGAHTSKEHAVQDS